MSKLLFNRISLKSGIKITDKEFTQLRDFIYGQMGIWLDERKKYLIENRFSNRLGQLGLSGFSEYYTYLKYDSKRKEEMDVLVELVTTNETSFFRDTNQLKAFQNNVLKDLVARQAQAGRKELNLWSAGCSSGEEPYTLAILLLETLRADIKNWNIRITANDISQDMLKAARAGLYRKHSLRTTPPEIVKRYFTEDDGMFRVKPIVTRLVSFGRINLSNALQLKRVPKSHLVFCRNVIIYFDEEMKKKVINAFYDNLMTGGYLTLGHSESLYKLTNAFTPQKLPGSVFYHKS